MEFCQDFKSTDVAVSDDGLTATVCSSSRNHWVLGNSDIYPDSGEYRYELVVSKKSPFTNRSLGGCYCIGLAPRAEWNDKAMLERAPTSKDFPSFWGWFDTTNNKNGSVWDGNQKRQVQVTDRFRSGDVVTLVYDSDKRALSFLLNGEPSGVELNVESDELLTLAVCLYNNDASVVLKDNMGHLPPK
eukprot:m.376322 g.376322  ORF g.376322 m.376322 type:complete len:187 (-) comp20017_c0_seq16:1151-1711(-)